MRGKREPLHLGFVLHLGGVRYVVEKVEGMGGNAIVYRASYEDALSTDRRHQVLIKELFPYETKGWMYRDENGGVVCLEEGKEWFLRQRQSFVRGNEANLELLEREPDQVLGNHNSYEAYGTLYSVLTLHGGETLEEILKKKERFGSLKEITQAILALVSALSAFHGHGFLHLDISPDNILVLPERMLLIDYNSVWAMDGTDRERRLFSIKDGYSAPEVRLKSEEEICEASDLYSVCAVFFEMVTGRRLSDEEIIGGGLKKCLRQPYPSLAGAPASALWQERQILTRGLNPIARRRYQNTGQLKADLEELARRIEGVGITHSALWESSREQFYRIRGGKKEGAGYAQRTLRTEDRSQIGREALKEKLENGEKLLLTGSGGMGKTSFLMQMWEETIQAYRPSAPVWCYLSLADYQHSPKETSYIQKCLLLRLSFGKETGDLQGAADRLKKVMRNETGESGNVVLLLDGLNEAGSRREALLMEIEELASYKNLGIVLTDRSEDIRRYAVRSFQHISLEPLKKEEIVSYLEQSGISCGEGEALLSLLQNPMMMRLYERTAAIRKEAAGKEAGTEPPAAVSAEGLMEEYFQSLHEQERRQDSGDEQAQLCYAYLTRHLLTEIAVCMSRKNKTVLTLEELDQVAKKSYRNLKSAVFTKAFEEYFGKSRIMLRGIEDGQEWFDYAVSEELTEKRHFLERTEQGGFQLIHENFLPFLTKKAQQNRRQYRKYVRKRYGRKTAVAAACIAFLIWGGKKVWDKSRPFPATEAEIRIVENAMSRLTWNLGILERQLSSQQTILERAVQQDVLSGESSARESLREQIDRTRDALKAAMVSVRDGQAWIGQLQTGRNTIALDALETLYERPVTMQVQIEAAMEHLERHLCEEETYRTQEQKRALIEAYQEYLERCADLCYLEIQYVLEPLGQEETKEVTDFLAQSSVFAQRMVQDSLSGKTKETLEQQIEAARSAYFEAENGMRRQNYEVTAG